MNIFDVIIDQVESDEQAVEWAEGFVFSECEVSDADMPKYHRYVDTVQGDVEVYYDYGADYYFFVEAEEDEWDGHPDEAQEWYDFDPDC